MAMPEPKRMQGLRISDLIGLVIGYSMAALLARSVWPGARSLTGGPAIALGLGFLWLGLAMSGPVVLLLDRRGVPSTKPADRRPKRPGRLISAKVPPEPPIGQRAYQPRPVEPARYTRAELAWMITGGYWIALTMFVVPALSVDTPWALVGLVQVVAAIGLWVIVPRRAQPGTAQTSWTHFAAIFLMATWPIAWAVLILLSKSL